MVHYCKAEVDFVIRRGAAVIPMEVKYHDPKKMEARQSYHGFLERYHPECGYVVTKSLSAEAMVGKTLVRCLPYRELMFA